MDINEAKRLGERLLRKHGLDVRGWRFRLTARMYTKGGTCDHRRKHINVNKIYAFTNAEFYVRDTILHEIAHALEPGEGHGERWVKRAQEIGCTGSQYVLRCANWMGQAAQSPRLVRTSCTHAGTRYSAEDDSILCPACRAQNKEEGNAHHS